MLTNPLNEIPQAQPETATLDWFTSNDGATHFYRRWGAKNTGPCIVYIHGIESHGRWFEGTALKLVDHGYTVYALDRRGSGNSPMLRGHASSHNRLIQDIEEFILFLKKARGSAPVFLIANCWGAKPAVVLAARQKYQLLNGLVLISPAISVKVDVSLLTKVKVALSYLLKSKTYFDIPLLPQHFTDQTIYLQYIQQDPLRLKQVTASFLVANLRLSLLCYKAASRLTTPLLILQAGQDAIVNVDGVKNWFRRVATADKTLQIFPNAAHSLDFDPIVHTYHTTLCNWISNHGS